MLTLVWFKRSLYYFSITTDDVTIGRRDEDFSQGATSDFKWQGWSNGAKYQNPKKSHAEFLSLKNLQKGKQIWMYFNRKTTLSGYAGTIMFWVAKKIPAQIRLPKKILAKFYYLKISRNRKFQTSSLSQSGVTPWGIPTGCFEWTMLKLDRQTCSCQ